MYIRKLLRVYVCVQAVVLLVVLAALCADIAAARTRFIAEGAPASAQRETPLTDAAAYAELLPDKQVLSALKEYAGALPAPLGCFISMIRAFRTLYDDVVASGLVDLHKNRMLLLWK